MPSFVEMDPELALKAIEGHENALEPENRKMEAFYRQFVCPRCEGKCEKHFISAQHAFGAESIVPRYALKCVSCGCVFDPHANNLIVELGSQDKYIEQMMGTPVVGRPPK